MAGTTIWKGFIHFKETDVAVKLHSTVREERIRFNLLHNSDQARLRQQMICAYENQPVPAEEQIKGFEIEEGKYLLIDPEELEQALPEKNRLIEVHEFVNADQVPRQFVERVYALEPDSASPQARGYGSLVKALSGMGVVGICTWTMRKRSYFGALQAAGSVLLLSTLRYADEVVPAASLGLRTAALSERELAIGSELIEKMTAAFEPGKFVNEHEGKLRAMIDKKARGDKIAILAPRRLKPTGPDDLLATLAESLKKAA